MTKRECITIVKATKKAALDAVKYHADLAIDLLGDALVRIAATMAVKNLSIGEIDRQYKSGQITSEQADYKKGAVKAALKLLWVERAYTLGKIIGIGIELGKDIYNIKQWAKRELKECDKLSPLILDLNGNGVESDALTYFDHEGDGWSELSRWANEDDGVLVWDRNADGVINDGSELFGNNTVLSNGNKADNGFAALADLDDNGDGVVDSSDAAWLELRVMRWADANDDGIMQDDEKSLVTLESLGIKSLGTSYSNSDYVDESGNEHRQVGSYTKTDEATAKMTDVWFVTSTSDTTYDKSDIPAHSEAIKALPDMEGGGRMYDLRDAMALDDAVDEDGNSRLTAPYYSNSRTETRSLREMVEDFVETDADGAPLLDKTAREALAEKILLR